MNEQFVKCVAVGDPAAEKRSLFKACVKHWNGRSAFGENGSELTGRARVEDESCAVRMCNTSGLEDDHGKRVQYYSMVDVFMVCFSVVSPASVESVREKWIPEITRHHPDKPYFLVGTQIHLRADEVTVAMLDRNGQRPISLNMGKKLAKEFKAVKYVECSASTSEGLGHVCKTVLYYGLKHKNPKTKKCMIL